MLNTPSTEITHKGIIVIQSLKDTDRKTGNELQNDILQYKKYIQNDSFEEFYNVATVKEFIKTLEGIKNRMTKGTIFTLHLETHGSEEGIHLSSGEYITWKHFFDTIRPINIKMGHLLIVTMAMCKGGALIKYIEPKKRAPYKAFIGAFRDLSEDEIARGFSAFYSEYYTALDVFKGLKALNMEVDGMDSNTKTFWCYTSEKIFDLTLNPDRDPKNTRKMARDLIKHNLINGKAPISLIQAEIKVRKLLKEDSEKYRDYFNFKDILGN